MCGRKKENQVSGKEKFLGGRKKENHVSEKEKFLGNHFMRSANFRTPKRTLEIPV